MSAKRRSLPSVRSFVAVSQPPALGLGDLRAMADAVFEVAPSWTTELHGICVDEAILIVMPDGAEDLLGPSFVLTRETFGYRVDQVHWDMLTEVGAFSSFGDAVSMIRHRISLWQPSGPAASVTRH